MKALVMKCDNCGCETNSIFITGGNPNRLCPKCKQKMRKSQKNGNASQSDAIVKSTGRNAGAMGV
jgi:predicted nucleic acid-binding Zn ribbon protein